MNINKIFAVILALIIALMCTSCANNIPDDKNSVVNNSDGANTSVTFKNAEDAERYEYLQTVTYCNFELTESNEPYYLGRWFNKEINGESNKVTLTAGSCIYLLTDNCISLEIDFTVNSTYNLYFAYSVDGAEPIRQSLSDNIINLPDGRFHTVRIIADAVSGSKWNDEEGMAVKGINAATGNIIGIKPVAPIIFFYGDSITEGINALGEGALPEVNSAVNAYPWHCTEKLGAVSYTVGYGGSGISENGSFRRFVMAIEKLSAARAVDKSVIPDVIIINHGTNDKISDDEFKSKLKTALEKLREYYPNTPVVYLIPFNQSHSKAITETVSQIDNAYVIQTAGWNISLTDWGHPNAAGAKVAGEKTADAIMDILGEKIF